MQFFRALKFKKQYKKLPQQIKETTQKQLDLLLLNPKRPSLNLKKMRGTVDIWECRVTDSYRFTFQVAQDYYILRKIGTHNILKNP